MAQLYFHCSSPDRVMRDRRGSDLALTDAHAHAVAQVRRITAMPTLDDWRAWTLRVLDEAGEEVLAVPFAAVLGRPH